MVVERFLPRPCGEVRKERDNRVDLAIAGSLLDHEGQTVSTSLLDSLQCDGSDGYSRRAVDLETLPDIAAMARAPDPHSKTGDTGVPDGVFDLAWTESLNGSVRQPHPPRLGSHARPSDRTGATTSTASRTAPWWRCV